jgi:hypothetical protein
MVPTANRSIEPRRSIGSRRLRNAQGLGGAALALAMAILASTIPFGIVLAVDPPPPSRPDLDAASDTGSSSTDNLTADATPTFSGTSAWGTNSVVQLRAESWANGLELVVGTGFVSGSGTWSITSFFLRPGTYSFTASPGSVFPPIKSEPLVVWIDEALAPPSRPDLLSSSDSGPSSTDNITSDTTPTFTGTSGVTAFIDLYAGAARVGTAAPDGSGGWTITSSTLPAGTHLMTAIASDVFWTSASSPGLSVTIQPSLGVTLNQAASQGDPTSIAPINFSVGFTNPVADFTSADVSISGTAGGTKTATVTGGPTTYNVAINGMTNAGTVIASVGAGLASDAAGNVNTGSTTTDDTVTWTPASPAAITLTTSAPITPGAKDPVILWGEGFTLGVQFGANGANKTFQLQGTRDELSWTTISTLTTDASGHASLVYRPVTNLFYRAVFAGTPDLATATSNQVRTVVRQLAVLRPTNSGSTRSISRNASITFSTTVRPARPELAAATVTFSFYHQVAGLWQLATTRAVVIDSAGKARTTFTFSAAGQWYVRSQAGPTPYNANSVLTPVERYSVG